MPEIIADVRSAGPQNQWPVPPQSFDFVRLHNMALALANEVERLDGQMSREVTEFNAGWQCAVDGGRIEDEPNEGIVEDNWRNGFESASYIRLKSEVERLQAELDSDSFWPIVERFLSAAGIEPTSWHETTPEQIERAIATVAEWQTKVNSLPKTADGVPIHLGMNVWRWDGCLAWCENVTAIDSDRANGLNVRRWWSSLGAVMEAVKESSDG
jgi:hypothetical protein